MRTCLPVRRAIGSRRAIAGDRGPKRSTDGLRVQVFSSGPDQFRVGDVAGPSSQFACKT